MSTHLYCVLPRAARAPLPAGLVGVENAPVRALEVRDIVAWVSDAALREATLNGVRAHDAVVQAALDTGTTPAPVRYGQRFADDAACRDALDPVAPSLAALLASVQGFVEMRLVLAPATKRMLENLQPVIPGTLMGEPDAGRRYLELLRARDAATTTVRQGLAALGARLDDAVHHLVRRSVTQEQLTRMPLHTIAHLVARELVAPYRDALRRMEPGPDYRFIVIGPRAPYSFCAVGGGSDGHHGTKLAD
jgi:hypothetical protein